MNKINSQYKVMFVLCLLAVLINETNAQELGPGSIAVIGWNTAGDNDLAILALDELPDTTIYFTDHEWVGDSFSNSPEFSINDGTYKWETTSIIPSGTVITFSNLQQGPGDSTISSHGLLSFENETGGFRLNGITEQVYFYLGAINNPIKFLTVFATGSDYGNYDGGRGSLENSQLQKNVTAGLIGNGLDGGEYIGVKTGRKRDFLTWIYEYDSSSDPLVNWDTYIFGWEANLPFDSTPFTILEEQAPQINTNYLSSRKLVSGFDTLRVVDLDDIIIDPDGDDLAYEVSSSDSEIAIAIIDSLTKVLYIIPSMENKLGLVEIALNASDGIITNTHVFEIEVVSGFNTSFPNPAVSLTSGATFANSVYSSDIDQDGDLDIIGAAFGNNSIYWYENDGDGGFTEYTVTTSASGVTRAISGDIDSDGDMDILSANSSGNTIKWYENDGNENFTSNTISGTATSVRSLVVSDVDSDGDLDIAAAEFGHNLIAWYENDGTEGFTKRTVSSSVSGVYDVKAIDVDNDGDIDFVSSNSGSNQISWYENDGVQNFTKRDLTVTLSGPRYIDVWDVDTDGDIDIISTGIWDDRVAWHENDGSQNFTQYDISTNSDAARVVEAVDMDGDGDVDIVASIEYDNTVAWFENDGSENFTKNVISDSASVTVYITTGDLDGDGDLEVISANWGESAFVYYENKELTFLDNTVAYYPFNGNANDESGNDYSTNTNGSPTLVNDRFGELDKAYSFDGVDDYFVSDDVSPFELQEFTFSMWMKPDDFIGQNVFFGKDDVHRGFLFYTRQDSSIAMQLGNGTWNVQNTNSELSTKKWTHFVSTYDGTNLKAYFDGELDVSGNIDVDITYITAPLVIGASSVSDSAFNGNLDDIRIFNTALTSNQILELYQNFHAPNLLSAQAGAFQIDLNWDLSPLENIESYNIFADDSLVGTTLNSSFTISGLNSGQEYDIYITSTDSLGYESQPSDTLQSTPLLFLGSGSEVDPYQVSTATQLDSLRNYLDSHFILMNDIDLDVAPYNSGEGWEPIGTYNLPFNGSFNGQNYSISNLFINRIETIYVGLFGFISGIEREIKNLALKDINIQGKNSVGALSGYSTGTMLINISSSGQINGGNRVGGIVGEANSTNIYFCSTTSTIEGETVNIGGIVGFTLGKIINSYSKGIISGDNTIGGIAGQSADSIIQSYSMSIVKGPGAFIGGVAGISSGSIIRSFATGLIEGGNLTGGLIGYGNYQDQNGLVKDSYSSAFVKGNEDIGGLIGNLRNGTLVNSYSFSEISATTSNGIGGLIGLTTGTNSISSSYWNSELSSQSKSIGTGDSSGIERLSPSEMMQETSFTGWDFDSDSVWAIVEKGTLPYLNNVGLHTVSIAAFDGSPGWRTVGNAGNVTYDNVLDRIWTQGYEGSDGGTGVNSNVFYFDESSYTWKSPNDSSNYFGTNNNIPNDSLRGALVWFYADDDNDGTSDTWPKYIVSSSFKRIQDSTFTIPLSYSNSEVPDSSGWHLISNPYPTSLDWEGVISAGDNLNVLPIAYIWDHSLNGNNGGYKINFGYPLPPGAPEEFFFDGDIPLMQSFWVKATDASASLTFRPEYQNTAKNPYKSSSENKAALKWFSLKVKTGNFSDQFLLFRESNESIDMNMPKLKTLAGRFIELSAIDNSGSNWLSYSVKKDQEKQIIPLELNTSETGTFIFNWNGFESLNEGIELYLLDKKTGIKTSIVQASEYEFNISKSRLKSTNQRVSNSDEEKSEKQSLEEDNNESRFGLEIINSNVTSVESENSIPESFVLSQNYPNPFNPSSTIQFGLPEASSVRLEVFNLLGQKVNTLVTGDIMQAGWHSVQFDAGNLASGVYIYRIEAGNFVQTKRMLLIK